MKDDPIIAELRLTRRRIMERFGNDPDRYWAHLRAKEKEHPERYVSLSELKVKQMAVAEARASYGAAGPKKRGE